MNHSNIPHMHPFKSWDVRRLVETQAISRANHPFIVWQPFSGPAHEWSYAEFAKMVCRVAAGLHERGVKHGDYILVHLDNCPESVFSWIACSYIGAIAVTTNARAAEDELRFYAEQCGAKAAITQPRLADTVRAACPNLQWLAITATDNGEEPANPPSQQESFEALLGDPNNAPRLPPDPCAPFSVQFTSGTTSRPKGVLWTQANALWGARVCSTHEDLRPQDVHFVHLPLFHTNAQVYSVLSCLWVGATAVITPRFSASRFWDIALKHRCTWASMVPFCLHALAQHPAPREHAFRLWGMGASFPAAEERYGVKTIGWWGMTETVSQGIMGSPLHPNHPMAIGQPTPEYELRILNADGRPVEPGETGELFIRGFRGLSIFKEYLHLPEATEAAFTPDGFFITGDRVTLLENGSIAFADRIKDMLKVGGENVAASEIERVLMTVAGIREAAVVGKPDPLRDEVPFAFILLTPDASSEKVVASAAAQCRASLADFKRPTAIRVLDEFPRGTLAKVNKVALRDMTKQ